MRRSSLAAVVAASMMGSVAAAGGSVADVQPPAQSQSPSPAQSQAPNRDRMPGEARTRAVQDMVLKRRRKVRRTGPRGDGFDDARLLMARQKRARKGAFRLLTWQGLRAGGAS